MRGRVEGREDVPGLDLLALVDVDAADHRRIERLIGDERILRHDLALGARDDPLDRDEGGGGQRAGQHQREAPHREPLAERVRRVADLLGGRLPLPDDPERARVGAEREVTRHRVAPDR